MTVNHAIFTPSIKKYKSPNICLCYNFTSIVQGHNKHIFNIFSFTRQYYLYIDNWIIDIDNNQPSNNMKVSVSGEYVYGLGSRMHKAATKTYVNIVSFMRDDVYILIAK